MDGQFKLIQGVSVEDTGSVVSAYCEGEDGFEAVLSQELLLPVIRELTELLDEPVFFFLELPRNADEEDMGYDVYYLDNCTMPVAKAILKRYGELLVQDGISRFGFGAHNSGAEVYATSYQQLSVYAPEKQGAAKVFEKHGIKKTDKLITLWDSFTEQTPGISIRVELNGETVFDIPENLKGEGMYRSEG